MDPSFPPEWGGETTLPLPTAISDFPALSEAALREPKVARGLYARTEAYSFDERERLQILEWLMILLKDTMPNYPLSQKYFNEMDPEDFLTRFFTACRDRDPNVTSPWRILQVVEEGLEGIVEPPRLSVDQLAAMTEAFGTIGRAIVYQVQPDDAPLSDEDRALLDNLFLYPAAHALYESDEARFVRLFRRSNVFDIDGNNRLALLNGYMEILNGDLSEYSYFAGVQTDNEQRAFGKFCQGYAQYLWQQDAAQKAARWADGEFLKGATL
ncbi:MAG: hypothetical protein Q8P95_02285 [bacterium]|nr:hypothetical protein [bacterium]